MFITVSRIWRSHFSPRGLN